MNESLGSGSAWCTEGFAGFTSLYERLIFFLQNNICNRLHSTGDDVFNIFVLEGLSDVSGGVSRCERCGT